MRSHVAFDGPYMLTVVHELRRSADNVLAATATDGYAPADSVARDLRRRFQDVSAPMPDAALPRSLGTAAETSAVDRAPHVWNMTPMTDAWLTKHGFGRVAVEMKLAWTGPLKPGDPVVTYSGLTGAANSTFSFRHHLFEARTHRLAAVCDVVALTMDLKTRSAVSLDDEVRASILKSVLKA
eukprot:jgi/Tetstr1/435264/TSEL_024183.t1